MPLSEHEQRLFDQIERSLAEDPKFASAVRASDPRFHARRRLLVAAFVIIAGLALVVYGTVSSNTAARRGGLRRHAGRGRVRHAVAAARARRPTCTRSAAPPAGAPGRPARRASSTASRIAGVSAPRATARPGQPAATNGGHPAAIDGTYPAPDYRPAPSRASPRFLFARMTLAPTPTACPSLTAFRTAAGSMARLRGGRDRSLPRANGRALAARRPRPRFQKRSPRAGPARRWSPATRTSCWSCWPAGCAACSGRARPSRWDRSGRLVVLAPLVVLAALDVMVCWTCWSASWVGSDARWAVPGRPCWSAGRGGQPVGPSARQPVSPLARQPAGPSARWPASQLARWACWTRWSAGLLAQLRPGPSAGLLVRRACEPS